MHIATCKYYLERLMLLTSTMVDVLIVDKLLWANTLSKPLSLMRSLCKPNLDCSIWRSLSKQIFSMAKSSVVTPKIVGDAIALLLNMHRQAGPKHQ